MFSLYHIDFNRFCHSKISDRIQYTIAITATATVGSLILLIAGSTNLFHLDDIAQNVMQRIYFKDFLLNGILGFLLFAGALGIKLPVLKSQKLEITILALFSTIASTLFCWWNFLGLILGVIAHFLISATDDGSLEILPLLTIPTAGFMLANCFLCFVLGNGCSRNYDFQLDKTLRFFRTKSTLS